MEVLPGVVGRSASVLRMANSIRRCAPHTMPVLLRGESGTGKELAARAVHQLSGRATGPWVALNAATLAPELAGSELFGHRRGAFTGASGNRTGAFVTAHRGTLFIDEVASLPLGVQAQLLRVVEDGLITPLGGQGAPRHVDVRLVAATCEPLERMVRRGNFRGDLHERLRGFVVQLPALRERLEDLPMLASRLLNEASLGGSRLSSGVVRELRSYHWPGNIRELRNVLVSTALLADGGVLRAEHLRATLAERAGRRHTRLSPAQALSIYVRCGHNVSRAAREAALPRSTFRDLLARARTQSEASELKRFRRGRAPVARAR